MPGDTTHAAEDATTSSFEGVRTADVNGAALAYREQGEGKPVVFVHGSADDLRSWAQQLPAIGASYRAIAYSRRYARPNEDIEPDADNQTLPHVDDLVSLPAGDGRRPRPPRRPLMGRAHLFAGRDSASRSSCAVSCSGAARAVALHEHAAATDGAAPALVRRPRTALTILSFGAKTALPAEKAFRRGDDEAGAGEHIAQGCSERRPRSGFRRSAGSRRARTRARCGRRCSVQAFRR